jgi:probable rRNA maturation factor
MPTSATRSGRRASRRRSYGPKLRLTIQNATGAAGAPGLPARSTLRRWLLRALGTIGTEAAITVRFVGSAEGRRLNRDFRGRDYPTNVLTFIYDASALRAAAVGRAPLAGDLVFCMPVVRREAGAARISVRAHLAHLSIHGALHLQGYDHQSAKDAKVMEALEIKLLNSLGYADPYATGRPTGSKKH